MKINNRAQLGSTLTWFTATIIVFVMILLYLGLVGVAASSRSFSSVTIIQKNIDLEFQDRFVNFLEDYIDFQEQIITTYDLAMMAKSQDDVYHREFVLKGKEFLSGMSSSIYSENSFIDISGLEGSTIEKESFVQFGDSSDNMYAVAKIMSANKYNCNAKNSNYFEISISKNKKIIVCMEYKK